MTEHRPLGKFFSSAVSVTKHDNSAYNMASYFVASTVRFTKAISPDSSKPDQWFLTGNIGKTIPKMRVRSYHNYHHNYSQRCIFTNMGKLETRTKRVRTAPSLSQFPKNWLHERLEKLCLPVIRIGGSVVDPSGKFPGATGRVITAATVRRRRRRRTSGANAIYPSRPSVSRSANDQPSVPGTHALYAVLRRKFHFAQVDV